MLLELLAAAVAVTTPPDPGAAPPASTAPVVVHPLARTKRPPVAMTVEVPAGDTQGGYWASIWPSDALRERLSGHVVLTCHVDRFGIAESCEVASETPAGKGFGPAALLMRTTLALKPPIGPDGPTDADLNIAIDFDAPDPDVFGGGPSGVTANTGRAALPQNRLAGVINFSHPLPSKTPITVLNNPVWARAASFEDLARAYPAAAKGSAGYAVAHCQVLAGGRLTGCQVIKAAPEHRGFGEAAVALAARFRVAPQWSVAPQHQQLWVDIPIRFPSRSETADRTVASPYWTQGFDADQALKVFPPEAAARGLTTGRAVAQCVVTGDGALTECRADAADPEGLGFEDAAVKLASTMRMNPWTADGSPVDGDTVLVNIRLNLKAEP